MTLCLYNLEDNKNVLFVKADKLSGNLKFSSATWSWTTKFLGAVKKPPVTNLTLASERVNNLKMIHHELLNITLFL